MSTLTVEQKEAGLMQMKINTRLTALQTALELMKAPGYALGTHEKAGTTDHVTLLAMAGDIEAYIIGDLEKQAADAIEAAKKPQSKILQVRP